MMNGGESKEPADFIAGQCAKIYRQIFNKDMPSGVYGGMRLYLDGRPISGVNDNRLEGMDAIPLVVGIYRARKCKPWTMAVNNLPRYRAMVDILRTRGVLSRPRARYFKISLDT